MRLAARGAVVGLLLVLAGAGCGSGGGEGARRPPATATTAPSPAGGAPFGPGISVAEALRPGIDGPVLVNGFLVADAAGIRLCTALQESMPPGCGDPALEVRNVRDDELDRLVTSEADGTRWSDAQVQVLGAVRDDRLVVTDDMRA